MLSKLNEAAEVAAAHGHDSAHDVASERLKLGPTSGMWMILGIIAAVAVGLPAWFTADKQRFLFSYLTAWAYFMSLALGALFAVVVHHASRAGWNVTVRRTTENIAATIPVLWLLSIPLLVSIVNQKGTIYRWAIPTTSAEIGHEEGNATEGEEFPATASETARLRADEFKNGPVFEAKTKWKRAGSFAWYSNAFFFLRIAVYFATWSWMALWFRKLSIQQDRTGDPELTRKMEKVAPVCLVILGLGITFAAFDLIMSLDVHWYSTMFGVYYIAGSILGGFATVIVALIVLQATGYLTESVTTEHYHDLGKYLFAFTFFWGYIAFGQYMLLWYSSIPEEVSWYSRHGATTLHPTAWSKVIVAILFGKFAIPFLGLLSRHVKRNRFALCFWAIWVMVFQYIDVYWMVMPEFGGLKPAFVDLGAFLIIGGLFLAAIIRNMSAAELRPTQDPRLPTALAFTNI